MAREGRVIELECGCIERVDVAALAGRVEVKSGGCGVHGPEPDADLEHAAELAGELAGELEGAVDAGRGDAGERWQPEPFALACVNGARTLVLELMNRHGVSSRVARLALERALAELEAALRELEKLEGHGVRRS